MDDSQLKVKVLSGPGSRRVVAQGELDLAGAQELDAALVRVDQDAVGEVVLDLRGVTFIDSSGIRCVLDAHHRAETHGVQLRIMSGLETDVVFNLAGLAGRLPFVA